MGGVIVDDGVNRLSSGNLLLDDIEEANELLMAMALHVAADHRAVEDVHRGEQRRRAVALIVVRHGSGASTLLQRQSGLVCGQAPEIWLFRRPTGRWRARADRHRARRDVAQFVDEARIVGQLELAHPVRLQAMGAPDALDRTHAEPSRLAPSRLRSSGSSPPGGSPSVKATTPSIASALSGLIREGRVLSRTRPSNPSSRKRSCQRQTQVLDLGRSPHDLVRADAIGGQQHDFQPARRASAARCGLAPQLSGRRISADETERDFPARIAQTAFGRARIGIPARTHVLGSIH